MVRPHRAHSVSCCAWSKAKYCLIQFSHSGAVANAKIAQLVCSRYEQKQFVFGFSFVVLLKLHAGCTRDKLNGGLDETFDKKQVTRRQRIALHTAAGL